MGVISLRLKDRDMERLDELSRATHKDKSTMARELLEYGWEFVVLEVLQGGQVFPCRAGQKVGCYPSARPSTS